MKVSPLRRMLWERQGHRCHYCGRKTQLERKAGPLQATVDHVIPRSKGGETGGNVVMACQECNGKKADRMVEEMNHAR